MKNSFLSNDIVSPVNILNALAWKVELRVEVVSNYSVK
jgi:hypothetical protein